MSAKTSKRSYPRGQAPGGLRLEIREYLDRGEVPNLSELAKKHDVRKQRVGTVWHQELQRRGLGVVTQKVLLGKAP